MIKKLSLSELIEAAVSLDKPSRELLIAAISSSPHRSPETATNGRISDLSDQWAALAYEGLARAYGDAEPTYSDADLVP